MPKLTTRLLFLVLLSILASVSWWAHHAALFSPHVTLASKTVPKFFLNKVVSTRFNQSGEIASIFEFDSITQSELENESQTIRPKLIFHNSPTSEFTVTADAGRAKNNETIDLMGNVTLKITSAESVPTSVATDFVIVEIPSQIARTDHKTTITRQSSVGFSHGFIYHAKDGLLDLLSNVTMTYDD
ncbi:MAG: LPS export ABC transporter periplasmic protein LptC [Proteobacteria bacterium]|nr:LPS export ABC transporter periplasmic protein LptC [Pseudomonadota bacterium]